MIRFRAPLVAALAVVSAVWLAGACGDGAQTPASPTASPSVDVTTTPPLGSFDPSPVPTLSQRAVALRYFGHSMFQMFTPDGITILMDPHGGIGYFERLLPITANVVTVSHNHFDHDKVLQGGSQTNVVRGLTLEDDEWIDVDNIVRGDVRIKSFPTFHDGEMGGEFGKNSMFLFEVAGLRILHAGDIGHLLDPDQVQSLGRVDVLLIPVGGFFTINAAQADRVIAQLEPKLVFPMHYGTEELDNFAQKDKLATIDGFLESKTEVERVEGNTYVIDKDDLPRTTTVVVLGFK